MEKKNLSHKIHDYWNEKIIDWEKSAYEKDNTGQSLIEKTAGLFRGIVRKRMDLAVKIISPFVKDKTVIDIGCGSGVFAQRLIKYDPGKIIGIDISEKAIAAAKIRLNDKRCIFSAGDAVNIDIPEGDIIVGLGVLDFISREELSGFFKKLRSKYFLFSFPKRTVSPFYFMVKFYRFSQKCPTHDYYKFNELKTLIEKIYFENGLQHQKFWRGDNLRYAASKKMYVTGIIHNLPVIQ